MSIDEKIRAIMNATGWKQQKLAEVFEVSQSTVNRWLSGSEPEGHRRDAISGLYSQVVENKPTIDDGPIRDADDILKVLQRIAGLKPADVTVLLSVIQGFQKANAAQSSHAQPDDRSEPATARHE